MIVKNVPEPVFALGAGSFQMLLSDYPLDNGDHLITAFGSQSICPIDLEDKDAVQAALREYFPEAKVVSVESHNWNDDPWSQGGWRMNPPGLAGDFSRLMLEPIDSKLFLAGTDVCQSPLAGWIEGAVVSGYAAADKVTAFLKSKQSIKQSEI
jgi:monoamine oxidase